MINNKLIRKAFETRIKVWAAAQTPPLPIAYENAPFTPPAGLARYARVFVLPGSTDSRDLEGRHREYVGIVQVSFVMPLSTGMGEVSDLAQSLDDAFPVGPPMVQDTFNVWVTNPMSSSPPLSEPDHNVTPVTAPYKAEAFLP